MDTHRNGDSRRPALWLFSLAIYMYLLREPILPTLVPTHTRAPSLQVCAVMRRKMEGSGYMCIHIHVVMGGGSGWKGGEGRGRGYR